MDQPEKCSKGRSQGSIYRILGLGGGGGGGKGDHVVQTINTHKQEEKEPTLFPEENTPQPIYPLALLHYDTSHRGRHNSRCKNMCPRTGQ